MRTSKKILLGLSGLLILGLTFFLSQNVLVLAITLPDHQQDVLTRRMATAGDELCMHYIHSVERTPVQGWFALDPQGGFTALRTLTTGTGTGLPNVVDAQDVHMQGRWMVVDEGKTHIPEIPFYYLPLNELRITLAHSSIPLDSVPAGSRMRITCTPMSRARALLSFAPLSDLM